MLNTIKQMDLHSHPVKKLRRREAFILAAILIGLIAPLLVSTWYSHRIQSGARENALSAEADYLMDLLASGMRDPLWYLAPESGRSLLESTLKNRSVIEIRVTSVGQEEFLVAGDKVNTTDPVFSTLRRDVFYENKKIGEVRVVFDNSVSLQEARGLGMEILLTLAVQISISAILVYLLLRVFASLERSRAMQEMHGTIEESERNYRSLFENATVGIGRTDLNSGKALVANARLAEIFGYGSVDEFISEFNFADHYPDWDGHSRRLKFEERRQGETIEVLFTRRDGSLVFTEGEVRTDTEHEVVDFIIIDVTDRHRAKTALKEIEHSYQALFESANVGIGRTRISDARVLLANQKLAEMLGYEDSREFISEYRFMDNFLDSDSREKAISELTGKRGRVIEETFNKKDGSKITALSYEKLNHEAEWIDFVLIDITDLKLANKARQEYEGLINTLIEHSPIPISVKDLDGNYVLVSTAFKNYLDVSISDAVGKNASDLLQSEASAIIDKADQTVIKTGKSLEASHAFPVQLGSSTLQINKFPVKDEFGEVTGVATVGMDITEAVRTERELADRTAMLQQAESIAKLGHWKLQDGDRRMKFCSEQAAKIFGRSVSDLMAYGASYDKFMELVFKDDHEAVLEADKAYSQKVRDGADQVPPLIQEYRILLPDGGIRYLRETTEAVLDTRSSKILSLGTIQDITELAIARDELQQHRDQLELLVEQRTRKLKESEEKFRSFYEINPDVFMITDLENGTCLSVNDGFSRVTGYSRKEAIGKSTLKLNLWKNNRDRKKLVLGLKKDGFVNSLSAIFRRKDGSFWPGMMAACSVQLDGKAHVLSSTKDVSEIQKSQEAALRANTAKSEFLSSMSHELRTPLNAVLGFAQIMRYDSKEPLSERQNESVDIIINSGELLLGLINQVLELSKIEAGKLELNFEPVEPGIFIEECLSITQSIATPRSIKLVNKTIGVDLPAIQTDLTRVKQVLLNLLSNAVKYNRDGGSVTVFAEQKSNKTLRLSVKDVGAGLNAKEQKRVFDPFERLDQEATGIQGTGIGLAISKRLVEALGGDIGVESKPRQGSTFWIEFPVSKIGESRKIEPTQPVVEPDLNQPLGDSKVLHRLLYIEDNPMNAQLMQSILEDMSDIELVIAVNAEEGIDLANADTPDIILMDIGLPGMNGIEATGVLTKSKQTCDIPIIAISAAAMPEDIDKAKKAGVYAYVTKPFNINDFLQVLRCALGDKA